MEIRFWIALALGLMPVSACAAEPSQPPAEELTELEEALLKARAKLLVRLEQLVFGDKDEIDFRVGKAFPGLLGQTYFNGECMLDAPFLRLGERHPVRSREVVGLTGMTGNGQACNGNRSRDLGEILSVPPTEDTWQPEKKRRYFSIRYKQYVLSKFNADKIDQAFPQDQIQEFDRYKEGYFSDNSSCHLFLRKTEEGFVDGFVSAYFYQDADYDDLDAADVSLALVKDRQFLECSYRSKFVSFGLQGGATFPSRWLLNDLDVTIDRPRGVAGEGFYYPALPIVTFKSPANPVLFGTFNRLVASGVLSNGRLKRGVITQIPVKHPVDKIAWAGLSAFPEQKPSRDTKPLPLVIQKAPE